MDDFFPERLVYSSESEGSDIDQTESGQCDPPTTSHPLEKQIDDIFTAIEQQASTIGDDDDEPISSSKGKKSKKIICSDDDSDATAAEPERTEIAPQSDNGDTDKEDAEASCTRKNDEMAEKLPAPVRSTIWDSDTSSSGEERAKEPIKKTRKKVAKKTNKKEARKRLVEGVNTASDSKDGQRKSPHSDDDSSKSSSDTDEESANNDGGQPPARTKLKQRMSAKAAHEQIKEIQSESQRMARQLYINVPYHKPKQHSLKEFLNRRSLTRQHELSSRQPTQKAAAAIKMSSEELKIFAEGLEQRAQEAIEFFQNEDDEICNQHCSDENDEVPEKEKNPTAEPCEIIETPEIHDEVIPDAETVTENGPEHEKEDLAAANKIPLTDIESVDSENIPIDEPAVEGAVSSGEQNMEMSTMTSTMQIELHSEKTQLDYEIDKLINDDRKQKKSLALSLALAAEVAPKLSGDKNMIIDLETNEVKPREKSGIEELQERFLRNAVKKPNVDGHLSELSVFNTEIGGLEKISHYSANAVKVDPKPGQAYYKLKTELGKKINEKRRETLLKRVEDEKQRRKEMESDDDEEEMEEYSDCAASEAEKNNRDVADGDELEDVSAKREDVNVNGSDDEEAWLENVSNDSEAEDDDIASSAESVNESNEDAKDTNKTKRGRIITAFEDDSGDEMPPPNGQTSILLLDSSLPSLENSTTDSELPPMASTQLDDVKRQAIIDDMKEFESRLFNTNTQIQIDTNSRPETSTSALFPDDADVGEIGESQLMALCSGAFVTQKPTEVPITNEETSNLDAPVAVDNAVSEIVPRVDLKSALLSSDDENGGECGVESKNRIKKKTKKNKKKQLDYSDDEDDGKENLAEVESTDDEGEEEEEEVEGEFDDEEVDLGERFVEYDSDENEIEVKVKKKDLRLKASEFVEQEAELSESEWGSADEDEKGLDVYDADLLNDEDFDQRKIHSELERIRMRQQIDEDAREVRILKEMYMEDEEDISQRERKFRWKNIDNVDPSILQASNDNDLPRENEEDDNEEEWRRLRYEREQLLLQQINSDGNHDTPNSEAQNVATVTPHTSVSSIFRRTSIVKMAAASNSSRMSSPFLINQTAMMSAHVGRKSFLNRDEETLGKLAHLAKATGDGETIKSTATGKGNYVFISTAKTVATKRKSNIEDSTSTADNNNPSKKIKSNETKMKEKTKPSLGFFELLSK